MGILDQIANSGRGIGAGLLAGQQNQYAINQNKQLAQERQGQEARNRFVQDRQFNAQQNRYGQQDQQQANEAQMAFGRETMEILSRLPPEQRQQAFMARSQQAAQTVGLPPNFDPAQSWAQIEPMLPPHDQKLITGVDPKTGAAVRVPDRPGEMVYQKPTAPKPTDNFKDTSALRKEWTSISKDFVKQADAFGRIQASAADPSAAGDLALIFNYMKVLDPGSTVREGEFATAQNSAGVEQQVYSMYNRVLSGQRLSEEQRADFVDRAGRLFDQAAEQHGSLREQFASIAEKRGFDVDEAIPRLNNIKRGVSVGREPTLDELLAEKERRAGSK